jgi:hypothetical protein
LDFVRFLGYRSRVPRGIAPPWVGGLPVREYAIVRGSGHPLPLDIQTGGPALELMLGAKSMATNGQRTNVSRVICQKRSLRPYFVGTNFSSPSLWLLRYIQSVFD